jgi:hypothetical protein
MNVRARKAKEALKKAQRQHQNEVKEAHSVGRRLRRSLRSLMLL